MTVTTLTNHARVGCRSCGNTVHTVRDAACGAVFYPGCPRCGDPDPAGPMPDPDAIRFARRVVEAVTDDPPVIVLANMLTSDPWRIPFDRAHALIGAALRNTDQPTHGKV